VVSVMILIIAGGYWYFKRWDTLDRGFLVFAKNKTDRTRIKMRHAYMLQAQLQEEQALLAKASLEQDGEKPSLMKSKKMFRINESTNPILEEAFEKEKQDRMNIKRRFNYAYNYMAKVVLKNFKRRNKDDEYEDDSLDSSSDVSSIKESNRRGPAEPYKGHHSQRAPVFGMAVCE
jgi:hypothetical protein